MIGFSSLGARMTLIALSCAAVAIVAYGAWSVTLRRAQLESELQTEERNLSAVLREGLEIALEHRDLDGAESVVERFAKPDRVHGIAVHPYGASEWIASASLAGHRNRIAAGEVEAVLRSGVDRQLRFDADDRRFLVHLLPLMDDARKPLGVAEVWRDVTYIDDYVRATAMRLLVFAVALLVLLSIALAVFAYRAVTLPAAEVIRAMHEVASGNLEVRVAAAGGSAPGELGEIAKTFDALARSLREAREALVQSQQERGALALRLRRSERLATLGEVVAEVAHEMGTPLNVVIGRSGQLAEWCAGDERTASAARTVAEQSRRIAGIIRRLLDVARERLPQLEPVDLLAAARKTVDYLGPDLESAGVRAVVSPGEARAHADPDLVQQVLINLVTNAVHASPRGGVVRIEAEKAGGQVHLRVSDEGRGIAPEQRSKLFEPFATTKPPGQGTGLGLTIVRSVMRQLGGSVRYVEVPKGARFEATFLVPGPDTEVPRQPPPGAAEVVA